VKWLGNEVSELHIFPQTSHPGIANAISGTHYAVPVISVVFGVFDVASDVMTRSRIPLCGFGMMEMEGELPANTHLR